MQATTSNRRLWAAAQLLGLVLLVGAVLRQVEWTAVTSSYRGVSVGEATVAITSVLAAMGLRLWKWRLQVRAMGLHRNSEAVVARGFLLGVLLGAVTPLRLGELYRVAAAAEGESAGAHARAAAGVVLDKGYELFVVLATLALGALLVGMPWWSSVLAAAAAGAVGWLVLGRSRAPARGPLARPWAMLAAAKQGLGRRERATLLIATLAAHALNVTAGLLIWRAFGSLSVADFVVRIPLITLINTLPITIGGFGLRELAAIELFGPIGFPAAAAATAAAGLFFAANVLPALLLLPWVALAAWRRG